MKNILTFVLDTSGDSTALHLAEDYVRQCLSTSTCALSPGSEPSHSSGIFRGDFLIVQSHLSMLCYCNTRALPVQRTLHPCKHLLPQVVPHPRKGFVPLLVVR